MGDSWGRLGGLERALGAVLGAFWGRLGGLERALEALGGQDQKKRELFVALGAFLGASWGRLGAWIAVLGGLGAVLGRLKIHTKIDQKIDAFEDRILERFNGFW